MGERPGELTDDIINCKGNDYILPAGDRRALQSMQIILGPYHPSKDPFYTVGNRITQSDYCWGDLAYGLQPVNPALQPLTTETKPNPVCIYTNTEYDGTLGMFSEEIQSLLDAAGVTWPSIDANVCDYQKEEILNGITFVLQKLASPKATLNEYLPEFVPDFVITLLTEIPGVDKVDGIATACLAALQIGRGNFDEVLFLAIQALPGAGSFLDDVMENSGLKGDIQKLDNSLTIEQKETVIEAVGYTLTILSATVPVTAPFTTVLQGIIALGQKRWDEALEVFGTMGLSKIVGVILGPVVKKFKEIQDTVEAVYNTV